MLLLGAAFLAYLLLDRIVTATNALDGISLSEFFIDEFRIRLLPPPSPGRDCRGNTTDLVPFCRSIFRGNQVRIPVSVIRINSIGIRGMECTMEKGIGVYRIFVVGDSFTFGSGVGNEETFPAVLKGLLNDERAGTHFEVLNLGIPGASTDIEYTRLTRYLDYSPDLVILQTHPDDILECDAFSADIAEKLGLGGWRGAEWYRAAKDYSLTLDEDTRCGCVRASLQRIANTTAGKGVPLLIYEFDDDPRFSCFTRVQGENIFHLKAQPYSRNYRLSRRDGHLDREGNTGAAEELLPAVLSILDKTEPGVLR